MDTPSIGTMNENNDISHILLQCALDVEWVERLGTHVLHITLKYATKQNVTIVSVLRSTKCNMCHLNIMIRNICY